MPTRDVVTIGVAYGTQSCRREARAFCGHTQNHHSSSVGWMQRVSLCTGMQQHIGFVVTESACTKGTTRVPSLFLCFQKAAVAIFCAELRRCNTILRYFSVNYQTDGHSQVQEFSFIHEFLFSVCIMITIMYSRQTDFIILHKKFQMKIFWYSLRILRCDKKNYVHLWIWPFPFGILIFMTFQIKASAHALFRILTS